MPTRHFPIITTIGPNSLRNLNIIRLIVLLAQLAGLLWAEAYFDIPVFWPALFSISTLNTALILFTRHRCRNQTSVTTEELFAHLTADILLQTLFLYWAGGYTNPLISVYLVTVCISSALLPTWQRWFITVLSIAAYTALQIWYQPLTPAMHDMDMMSHGHGSASMVTLHLAGMWITFAISAILITSMVARMADSLRVYRARVAESRESQLRNERILSVAATAASAAHELGTPLTTMSILLKDMTTDSEPGSPLSEDIALLRSQIERCRERLTRIVQSSQNQNPTPQLAQVFIQHVLNEWQLLRPGVAVDCNEAGSVSCHIQTDQSLEMALINLLNNAADASPESVQLSMHLEPDTFILRIQDKGEALMDSIASRPGYTTLSTKQDGMGIGLQLSAATIENHGGSVSLFHTSGKGTVTEIRLPTVRAKEATDV